MKTLEKIRVVSLVGGVLTLLIFSPVLTFGFAYLGGLILKWIIGDAVCNGLNIVFNTTRFNPNLIPIVCATLATIGQYFKAHQTNNSK